MPLDEYDIYIREAIINGELPEEIYTQDQYNMRYLARTIAHNRRNGDKDLEKTHCDIMTQLSDKMRAIRKLLKEDTSNNTFYKQYLENNWVVGDELHGVHKKMPTRFCVVQLIALGYNRVYGAVQSSSILTRFEHRVLLMNNEHWEWKAL